MKRNVVSAAMATLLVCSCQVSEANFELRSALSHANAPVKASVLGVYREGAISDGALAALATESAMGLPVASCTPGYGENLRTTNHEAFAAIQAHIRVHGVGDELLNLIAPAAEGDFILVFEMYGQLSRSKVGGKRAARILVAHGGSEPISDASPKFRVADTPGLEMSASLFSVRLQRRVVVLRMEYTGPSLVEAIRKFAQKFRSTLPATTCGSWNWRSVRAVHDRDGDGLPLMRFRLIPTESENGPP